MRGAGACRSAAAVLPAGAGVRVCVEGTERTGVTASAGGVGPGAVLACLFHERGVSHGLCGPDAQPAASKHKSMRGNPCSIPGIFTAFPPAFRAGLSRDCTRAHSGTLAAGPLSPFVASRLAPSIPARDCRGQPGDGTRSAPRKDTHHQGRPGPAAMYAPPEFNIGTPSHEKRP